MESFNAAGDCVITPKRQVNVEKGREPWEAGLQTQQDLLNRTVMRCAEQEGETRVRKAVRHPCSFIQANHGGGRGLRDKSRANAKLTPRPGFYRVCPGPGLT